MVFMWLKKKYRRHDIIIPLSLLFFMSISHPETQHVLSSCHACLDHPIFILSSLNVDSGEENFTAV